MNETLSFDAWLASVLPATTPPGVVAYCFNMLDSDVWIVEVIGASSYDVDDEDWCCPPEAWSAEPAQFFISRDTVPTWEEAQEYVAAGVAAYLKQGDRPGAAVLRQAQAVCVGFVEGNLVRVWPGDDAAS